MHARDMYSIVAVVIEAVALRMPRDQPVQLVVLTIAEQPAQRIDIRARVDVDRIDMLLQLPLPIPNSPFFIRIETAFSWKPSACIAQRGHPQLPLIVGMQHEGRQRAVLRVVPFGMLRRHGNASNARVNDG